MKLQPAHRPASHYLIRGVLVTFDFDLAADFGLATRDINQIVKRNRARFPEELMFRLTDDEFRDWRSNNTTASLRLRNCRYRPCVFTTPGYVMLLSLLNSDFATRVFIKLLRNSFRHPSP